MKTATTHIIPPSEMLSDFDQTLVSVACTALHTNIGSRAFIVN